MPHGLKEKEHKIVFKPLNKNQLKQMNINEFKIYLISKIFILNQNEIRLLCIIYCSLFNDLPVTKIINKADVIYNEVYTYERLLQLYKSIKVRSAIRTRIKRRCKEEYPNKYKEEDFNKLPKCKNRKYDSYDKCRQIHNNSKNNRTRGNAKRAALTFFNEQYKEYHFNSLINTPKTYKKCVGEFNKSINPRYRRYYKNKAIKLFPNEYKEEDFPRIKKKGRPPKYLTYHSCLMKFNKLHQNNNQLSKHKLWKERGRIKYIAKNRFPNEYKEEDFISKRGKIRMYKSYKICVSEFNKSTSNAFKRTYIKNLARNKYPNEFNDNDFISKRSKK